MKNQLKQSTAQREIVGTLIYFMHIICTKMFLGVTKYYSVTNMLLLTGLPSFDTYMSNTRISDAARWNVSSNALIKSLLVV